MPTAFQPHVTVAAVIEQAGRFLLVQEQTPEGLRVNQPAGHLEPEETLAQAAIRETLEETGWEVELLGILGVALYRAPGNNITYYRTTFLGKPLCRIEEATLDPDIHMTHWLDYGQILARREQMRSPMVISDIRRHRAGTLYPLDLVSAII